MGRGEAGPNKQAGGVVDRYESRKSGPEAGKEGQTPLLTLKEDLLQLLQKSQSPHDRRERSPDVVPSGSSVADVGGRDRA